LYLFIVLLKDPRVIQPDVREHFLQSLGVLLQYKQHVRVLEGDEQVRRAVLPALLGSFDDKTWILISTIVLRFWKVRRSCGRTVLIAAGHGLCRGERQDGVQQRARAARVPCHVCQ
jgi:hypothetical protein